VDPEKRVYAARGAGGKKKKVRRSRLIWRLKEATKGYASAQFLVGVTNTTRNMRGIKKDLRRGGESASK